MRVVGRQQRHSLSWQRNSLAARLGKNMAVWHCCPHHASWAHHETSSMAHITLARPPTRVDAHKHVGRGSALLRKRHLLVHCGCVAGMLQQGDVAVKQLQHISARPCGSHHSWQFPAIVSQPFAAMASSWQHAWVSGSPFSDTLCMGESGWSLAASAACRGLLCAWDAGWEVAGWPSNGSHTPCAFAAGAPSNAVRPNEPVALRRACMRAASLPVNTCKHAGQAGEWQLV